MGAILNCCVRCATNIHDLRIAWKENNEEISEDIFNNINTINEKTITDKSLHSAVIDRNVNEINRILNSNISYATKTNNSDETAVHLACKLGYFDIVNHMLDSSCPADICTSKGTPIHCVISAVNSRYSVFHKAVKVIERLIQQGCNINATDKYNKTALFDAIELSQYDIANCLLNNGALVNIAANNSFTPLYMATIKGNLELVNLLLEHPNTSNIVDLNGTDSFGRSSLMAAFLSIINHFKYDENYLGVNSEDINSESFIYRYQLIAIIETLIYAGCDPNLLDNYNRNCMVVAFTVLEMDKIYYENQRRIQENKNSTLNHCNEETRELANESTYCCLVRLLLLYGGRLPSSFHKEYDSPEWMKAIHEEACLYGQMPQSSDLDIEQNNDLDIVQNIGLDIVQNKNEQCKNLLHQCVFVIRKHIGRNHKLHLVHKISLPFQLKHLLTLQTI